MKKYIVVQNSSPYTYDIQYGYVLDLLANKYSNIKQWDRTLARFPIRFNMSGGEASLTLPGYTESFTVNEDLILNSLDSQYDAVIIASLMSSDRNLDKTILDNLKYYGFNSVGLVDLESGETIDAESSIWYTALTIQKVGESSVYQMVVNNKLVGLIDYAEGELVSEEFEYLFVEPKYSNLKGELFDQYITFSNVKKVIGDTIFLDKSTTDFSIDLKSKVWGSQTDYFTFQLDVDTNMGYSVDSSTVNFSGAQDINYIEISIPNDIFAYAREEDKLIFSYKVLRS